jgi:hypothetical protein
MPTQSAESPNPVYASPAANGQTCALDSLLAILKTPELAAEASRQPAFWTEIKRLAEIHRFSGLLAESTSPWLPASQRHWCEQTLIRHYARHKDFVTQLQALTRAFADAGIPCVALKGPVLAERYFAKPFLKSHHDLDLLMRCRDIPAAARLIVQLGFRAIGRYPWAIHRRWVHDVQFRGHSDNKLIEIHFALKAGAHMIAADSFLERAIPWNFPNGAPTLVLSPPDECLYLVAHAAGHTFKRLRWLYDALAVAKTLNAADRERVRAMALEMRLTGLFVAADMACREFFGESLPIDLSGFRTPWLWSDLNTRHLRAMTRHTKLKFGTRLLDLCRISGSPAEALRLCAQNGLMKVPILLYRATHQPQGPDVLMKTMLD